MTRGDIMHERAQHHLDEAGLLVTNLCQIEDVIFDVPVNIRRRLFAEFYETPACP